MLAGARRPVVLMGDGVAASGAQCELTRVAEQLGADVWGVECSEVNMDARHPLYRGSLGHMFGAVSADAVRDADAVLVVGTYLFPEVFPELRSPFDEAARIIHIDLDATAIAKNHPVTLGLVADPRSTLAGLTAAIDRLLEPEDRAAATGRLQTRAAELRRSPAGESSLLAAFLRALADRVPEDVVVFDEGLTSSGLIQHHLPPRLPGHWFLTRGGSLGVGFPGAIGAKLAHPSKTVLGFTGDGGCMYTVQALATAARYGVGAKFVVCNNGSYRLLNENIEHYWAERAIPPHGLPDSFDLSQPRLGFVDLARGCGVDGIRLDRSADVERAVELMLADDAPFLVDVVTD
jgi:benzoylformate decarboxylase